ncbi:MAG TPA: pyridoxal phosphate-dependent aminotransferase, partial [Polyangiaceae bacterium]
DFDSVERARTQRTRAILVVSPNNPTGSYLKRDELSQLSRLGLPVISDEVFASYPLTEDPRRVRTALEMDAVLVFALGGLSKLAALPQFKLGWIGVGGPKALVEEALGRIELIADAYLTAAPPLQLALPALMDSRGVAHAAISARLKNNLEQLRSCLGPSAAVPLPVQGGWYAVLRLPAVLDEESWAIRLIERDGVWAHPGFFYDFAQEPFLVLSLLTPPAEFALGVERIRRRVEHPEAA